MGINVILLHNHMQWFNFNKKTKSRFINYWIEIVYNKFLIWDRLELIIVIGGIFLETCI